MPRRVNIVILCEDTQQGVFANRFLELAGKSIRVMRIEKGPGEAFVRKQFPKELAYYRARKHKVDQALIVIIDADTLGVTKRVKQLVTHRMTILLIHLAETIHVQNGHRQHVNLLFTTVHPLE